MQEKRQKFCRAIGIAAFRSRPWLDLQKPGGGMIFSNVRKELPVAQRLRGQNHFNASPNKYRNKSNNPRNID